MIHIYATTKHGDGYVTQLDSVEEIDGYELPVGIFVDDVVIRFEERYEKEEERAIPSGNRFVCSGVDGCGSYCEVN